MAHPSAQAPEPQVTGQTQRCGNCPECAARLGKRTGKSLRSVLTAFAGSARARAQPGTFPPFFIYLLIFIPKCF